MNKTRKISALALATVMGLSVLSGCSKTPDTPKETTTSPDNNITETGNEYGLADNIKDGTILHCFSWSFNTIAESMQDIALAGYTAVQTSPVNECYDGGDGGMDLFGAGKWYYHYQPTDWTIGNYQLGTKEEFTNMCNIAESYGIKVIVDVAPNHTTKSTDAISKNFLDAVGGLDKLYHSNGMEAISNYNNRTECTLMGVGGLYDVNTESKAFQDYFINFMNECIACGADGFRFDTAKHIGLADDPQDDPSLPNNFWDRVLSEIDKSDTLFNYGEVLQDGGERISDYINKIGATTASSYGSSIRNSVYASNLNASSITDFRIGNATPNIVTWVESHDNYTGDDATYKIIDNTDIILAWTVITASEKGTPLFFARPYGATSESMWGTFNKIGMAGDNLYKAPEIVAVNRFRNAMIGEGQNTFNPDGNIKVVFIERGTKGLVIVNSSRDAFTFSVDTALLDGTYTDRISGKEYTVKDGHMDGEISGHSSIILYNDGYLDTLNNSAVVKVSDDTTGNYISDTIEVTLVAENTTDATYSIDGGAPVSFKNGDVITIGEGKDVLEKTTLTLKGTNSSGKTSTMTYIFKRLDTVRKGTVIHFEKPADWKDKVFAYVYDETSSSAVITNAAWPGVEMQLNDDGTYTYTFEAEWTAPLVIFTDGKKQSNGQMEPGAAVVPDKLYTVGE